ncbi:MAG: GNAT family N-acetyltransferase [Dongiaceae bacterium]
MTAEWRRGEFVISTDRTRLDHDLIHRFLAASYWAPGIPRAVVERSIAHSLPFGLYRGTEQIGFARAVSDFATFAWLGDVFVVGVFRGRGLGDWLIETVIAHPDLHGLRRWHLMTRDAHRLYRKHGFAPLAAPDRHMEIGDLEIYRRGGPAAV